MKVNFPIIDTRTHTRTHACTTSSSLRFPQQALNQEPLIVHVSHSFVIKNSILLSQDRLIQRLHAKRLNKTTHFGSSF